MRPTDGGQWLGRSIAGDPSDVQIMYGVAGERRLAEWEADWLPGYERSAPVRIGNAAVNQRQLDVYGEVMDALTLGRQAGLPFDLHTWSLQRQLMDFLEKHWHEPDEGIWEVRGPRRHFVHSKVMAWVAFDRAIHLIEEGQSGPLERWKSIREEIHAQVLRAGLRRQPRHVHPVLRQLRAGRRGPAHAGGRVPAAGGPSDDLDGPGPSSAS